MDENAGRWDDPVGSGVRAWAPLQSRRLHPLRCSAMFTRIYFGGPAALCVSAPAQCAHVGIWFYVREFLAGVLLLVRAIGCRCDSCRLRMGGGLLGRLCAWAASFVWGFCAVCNSKREPRHSFFLR